MTKAFKGEEWLSFAIPNFLIIYKDVNIVVYHNGSGEIFVEPVEEPSATIRISPSRNCSIVTCSEGILTPTSVHGLPAFKASKR